MNITYYTQLPFLKWLIVLSGLLAGAGCKKEEKLEPSNIEENFFVVKDNPDDPVDHALYNFYQETGLACFYKDTIGVRTIPGTNNIPERYQPIVLDLKYAMTGQIDFEVFNLSDKSKLLPVLDLIKNKVKPKMSKLTAIPSILFIDSFSNFYKFTNIRIEHGMASIAGFNTLGVQAMDMTHMSEDDKEVYACSILAGFIYDRLQENDYATLVSRFFSLTRSVPIVGNPFETYVGIEMFLLYGVPVPIPESIGLTHFPTAKLFAGTTALPLEDTDLRAFIVNALRYTEAEIESRYAGFDLVIQKDKIVRELMVKHGFKPAK